MNQFEQNGPLKLKEQPQVVNQIKRWLKFWKLHRQLPISVALSQTISMKQYPQAHLLLIHHIEGLPRPGNNELQLGVRIIANMFMVGDITHGHEAQQKQANKCFFGRTYESPIIMIDYGQDGVSYQHHPINIYYHTRIQGSNSPLSIILEIQINEINGDIVQRRQNIGWIDIIATGLTNGPTKGVIKKGSPRVLENQQPYRSELTQCFVMYELGESQAFQECSYLIPENILIGFHDEVPGIKDNFIPYCITPQQDNLSLADSFSVFVSNIQVMIPDLFEKEIYKQVHFYRQKKYRVRDDYNGEISITSKRLVVAYNNGWNFVNSRGLNNFIPLTDIKNTDPENVNGRQISYKQLEYQGVIDINNITSERPESPNNFGMLILQLQYDMIYQVDNTGPKSLSIILGWLPIYLNDKIGMPSEQIDEEMILGPGKSITGRQLVSFTSPDLAINLVANLNLQGTGFTGVSNLVRQMNVKHDNNQQPQMSSDRFKQVNFEQDDIKSQIKMRDYERQLQNLKDENDRLKRQSPQDAQQWGRLSKDQNMGNQNVQNFQRNSIELDYLQSVEKLREENRIGQLNNSKQFEDLERLLRSQRSTAQQGFGFRSALQIAPEQGEMFERTNVLFDRTDLSKFKPIENIQYPLPQSTLRAVSKADTAFLLQSGIPGLLDGDPEDINMTSKELEDRTLKIEMDDDRKDTVIIIQPLAMKLSFQDEEMQDLGSLEFNVPKNLYFTLNFYDLPQYVTSNLILEFSQDQKALLHHLRNNDPLRVLQQKDHETHNIKFNIDTSTIRYNNLYKDFMQYLYRKCLLIDVWDADSKILFGSMKIPMRSLLRQGKQSQHLLKEVDILDTNLKRVKGSLQILIRNIGRQSTNGGIDSAQKDARMITQATSIRDRQLEGKRKIVSEKPVDGKHVQLIDKSIVQEKTQEQRVHQRINKLKMKNLSIIQTTDLAPNKQVAARKLNVVQKYKEITKPNVVRSIVQEFLSTEKVLNSFFGQSEIVPYLFTNTTNQKIVYSALIDDPDSRFLNMPEFILVTDPSEWNFWCNCKGFPEPYAYDMIKLEENSTKKIHYFSLEGGEGVTLLYKFLSFREVDVNLQFDPDAFEIAQQKGKEYIQKYIYPRHIQTYFTRRDSNQLVTEFRILIEPHMQVVDHVLRFYERDNRQTKIILPPLYTFTQPPEKRPIIHVTDPSIVIEWGRENNEIKLCLRVGDVRQVTHFNVLAYADTHCSDLVGNWQIEVHSLAGVDLEVPMGQHVMSRLTLPCDMTRVVRLFSSHSNAITFPDHYKSEFTLVPGKLNLIEYHVKSAQEGAIRAQLNCVDFNSSELVYSWLIKITTIPQPPSSIYQIKCIEGKESKQSLSYVNQTNYLTSFKFTTSHPYHLKIFDTSLQIHPMQRGEIRIMMLPRTGQQQIDAKVFITDLEERIYDTILLKINYSTY